MISKDTKVNVLKFLLLLSLISIYSNARERTFLTRSALLSPALTPWQRHMEFGDDSSFLLMTGMTRPVFYYLRGVLFGPNGLGPKMGRPPTLDTRGQLGLYLTYTLHYVR